MCVFPMSPLDPACLHGVIIWYRHLTMRPIISYFYFLPFAHTHLYEIRHRIYLFSELFLCHPQRVCLPIGLIFISTHVCVMYMRWMALAISYWAINETERLCPDITFIYFFIFIVLYIYMDVYMCIYMWVYLCGRVCVCIPVLWIYFILFFSLPCPTFRGLWSSPTWREKGNTYMLHYMTLVALIILLWRGIVIFKWCSFDNMKFFSFIYFI